MKEEGGKGRTHSADAHARHLDGDKKQPTWRERRGLAVCGILVPALSGLLEKLFGDIIWVVWETIKRTLQIPNLNILTGV